MVNTLCVDTIRPFDCIYRLYSAGSVAMILLNLNTFNTSITLNDHQLTSSRRDVYWLTPPGGVEYIMSKYMCTFKPYTLINEITFYRQVTLNGKLLELVDNSILPDLSPAEHNSSKHIHLPRLSFGFYVFKDANAEGCMPA